jgi:UDP-N-acetylmuramoylalanine--D-glutamate ligase
MRSSEGGRHEDSLDLAGKRVVVVGLARSGVAAARFLVEHGAGVVATDRKTAAELGGEAVDLPAEATLELGGHRRESFTGADLVVVSPGVPWEMPELEAARAAGVEVIAELELAYRFLRGRVVAVTGTKGKSTTTAAIGAMLSEHGYDTRVGGNIGRPAISMVDGATDESVFVLEVSSFQLEGIVRFHPQVAVFLNLSADHLDRHPSFEAYAGAKARIFENQEVSDWAVVNADDPHVLRLAAASRARTLTFGGGHRAEGAFFAAGLAQLSRDGTRELLFRKDSVRLPGAHLTLDLLAAAAAARLVGASADSIARAVASFRGAEHVLEEVATVRGVAFYNDSKATNLAAARKSLESFSRPVLVILGGRHKGGDFAELADVVKTHVKRVLAIGEAQETIERALGSVVPVQRCGSLDEAVNEGTRQAAPGDVVLLAPACSSFDMFKDYADRGLTFKAAVARLPRGGGD